VNGKNVGMVQGCGGARFLLETAQAVGVRGEEAGQDLDGDIAPQAGTVRAIDFPPPALISDLIS
jgi:hypothetical protein